MVESQLKQAISKSVDKAFQKIDSLMIDVVFSNRRSQQFDFSAKQVVLETSNVTTRAFVWSTKAFLNGTLVTVKRLIMKHTDVVLSGYTLVSVAGVDYKYTTYEANDFTITLELTNV